MAVASAAQILPGLADVSETMLGALHNRASEASRRGGILIDPDSLRLHQSIDYEIDRVRKRWIARHPDGLVVSPGEAWKPGFGVWTTAAPAGCPWTSRARR